MRHRSRMAHQRLYAAKAFSQCEHIEAAHQLSDIRVRTLELERNHTTEAAHLTFSKFMIRMRGQTRIIHLLHSWMLSQKPCDNVCILLVLAHAHSKRLYATQC